MVPIRFALLCALAWRFVWFGESDVRSRHFQGCWVLDVGDCVLGTEGGGSNLPDPEPKKLSSQKTKNVSKSGSGITLSYTTAILRTQRVLGVFSVLDVADCVLGTAEAKKKRGKKTRGKGDNRVALLEALAQLFVVFGESDKSPRVVQTRRIGGPGRG